MRVRSLRLQGFRSCRDLLIEFEPGLTTLVGENNVGKSTIGLGLRKIFDAAASGGDPFSPDDRTYGSAERPLVDAIISLPPSTLARIVSEQLLPSTDSRQHELFSSLQESLQAQAPDLQLTAFQPVESDNEATPFIRKGDMVFRRTEVLLLKPGCLPESTSLSPSLLRHLPMRGKLGTRGDIVSDIGRTALSRYKLTAEFRERSTDRRNKAIESWTGGDTPSVLLNLKNHHDRYERDRYRRVVETFRTLMPRYSIEAVEQSPGNNTPDVQFWEEGRDSPLWLSAFSAGVHQLLTLLTSLVAREGLVIFLEHPEQHLHPHSIRFVQALLAEAAERNQIIITSHDPHFVEPAAAAGLRRLWWTADRGTSALGPSPSLLHVQLAQIRTALRHLGNRELVFARAAVLVEDESQQEFLLAVARTLARNIDAHSVSVIPVGSEDGYKPYEMLIKALGIPYVALRDQPWNDNQRYPPDRFFSLGAELEQYLDKNGLAAKREAVRQEIGTSKRRVAGALGARLSKSEVPAIFDDILNAVISLAAGTQVGGSEPGRATV